MIQGFTLWSIKCPKGSSITCKFHVRQIESLHETQSVSLVSMCCILKYKRDIFHSMWQYNASFQFQVNPFLEEHAEFVLCILLASAAFVLQAGGEKCSKFSLNNNSLWRHKLCLQFSLCMSSCCLSAQALFCSVLLCLMPPYTSFSPPRVA